MVGSYSEKDFTANAGRALDKALDRHNIAQEIKLYAGAGHSFFNDHAKGYDKASAEDSWTRVLNFFEEQIGGLKTA